MLLQRRDYVGFMRVAVSRQAEHPGLRSDWIREDDLDEGLIREIPAHERLISIEDAQELVLDRHPNHVRLFYSKGGQGRSQVTPKQLLEACLRMKPDRILLAELRAEEAFDYLRNVNSGHPGSITSIHAASAELAFEQLVLLVKQNEAGREMSREDIRAAAGDARGCGDPVRRRRPRPVHQGNLVWAAEDSPAVHIAEYTQRILGVRRAPRRATVPPC